jgi:hypothetical protein
MVFGAGAIRAQDVPGRSERTHGTEPLRHTPHHRQALRLRPLTRPLSVLLVALLAAGALAVAGSAWAVRSARVPTLATGTKTYRGTGITSLGALGVRHTARLTWRHPRGGRLKLQTGPQHFPLVTTVKRSGSIRLRAGTYRELRVVAGGGWRIDISILPKR